MRGGSWSRSMQMLVSSMSLKPFRGGVPWEQQPPTIPFTSQTLFSLAVAEGLERGHN